MIDQISPVQLPAWIQAQSSSVVVLDVREPEELEAASVRPNGYTLVTIPMNEVPARLAELDRASPIACLCHRGARSQRVAEYLTGNGFHNVVNIAGGILAWTEQLNHGRAHD